MSSAAPRPPKHIESTAPQLTDFKWDVRQRLTLIDALALWRGELATNDLIRVFGIVRSQASKDLAAYQRLFPDNLIYDKTAKRYLPSANFKPSLVNHSADEFLDVIRASEKLTAGSITLDFPNTTLVEPLQQSVPADILRVVNIAIRRQHVIKFQYQSMSDNRPLETYEFAPHTLIHNGFRWHTRGYSFAERHSQSPFRDLVLSRFIEQPEALADPDYIGDDEDQQWHTIIRLTLIPHPGLSEMQRKTVASDYGMTRMRLLHELRAPLVGYFLRQMGIALDDIDKPAHQHQIVLENPEKLEPYVW